MSTPAPFLLTRVFPLGAVDGRAGPRDARGPAAGLRALGAAGPHPRGQRLPLGLDGGPADGAGAVAAGPGGRPGLQPAAPAAGQRRGRALAGTPGSGGRTRRGAPRPRSCSGTSTRWTGTSGRRFPEPAQSRAPAVPGAGPLGPRPYARPRRRACGGSGGSARAGEYAAVRRVNARGLVSVYGRNYYVGRRYAGRRRTSGSTRPPANGSSSWSTARSSVGSRPG